MAVFERRFHAYDGPLTPERTRFLVIPRYAFTEVFASRLFVAFLAGCFLWPLALAVIIYLPHNLGFLELIGATSDEMRAVFRYDEAFFLQWFLFWQGNLAFLLCFFVGPALISPDLRNNALPLYLGRAFGRFEYLLGKLTVLMILLSAITWVPGLLLFAFRSYLAGLDWFLQHARIAVAIFVASWIWILVLSLISLALSAYLKWKPIARAGLFGIFFLGMGLAGVLNQLLGTNWGSLLDVLAMMRVVWARLFGVDPAVDVPLGAAWGSLLAIGAACLLLLARRVRAYEVVR